MENIAKQMEAETKVDLSLRLSGERLSHLSRFLEEMGEQATLKDIRQCIYDALDAYIGFEGRKEPYSVVAYGDNQWAVVRTDDETYRPIGEKIYGNKTNAHRRKRQLNKAAQEIDEMIARDGAIII